jgi:curved DNA-binding protein CbpA
MDRRDNAETADVRTDEQLRKTLDVIGLSYKGAAPETLYALATRCFEGLMEISLNTDAVRNFAKRNELDIKYLVDGANFVISKMHFNPEENFYITLGLPRNASPEEIRQRWKNLMLLYHPDKQEGDEEWVSERAKKVNEAYSTLKDETRRSEYDRKLVESRLNSAFPSPAQRQAADSRHARPSREFSRRTSSSYRDSSAWESFRKYLPKVMIGIYALAAGLFLMYIYEQNRSASLETELLVHAHLPERPAMKEQAPAEPAAGQQPEKQMDQQAETPAPQAEKTIVPAEKPAEGNPPVAAQEKTRAEKTSAVVKETKKPAPAAAAPAPQAGKKGGIFSSFFRTPESRHMQEQRQEQKPVLDQKPEQKPVEQKIMEPQRPVVRQEPAPPIQKEVKAEPPQPPKDETVSKEEVDEFMKRYIRAYTQNDLEGFMALFSRSAVENSTMSYQDIRNAYRETFREKINNYRIQNMEIRTEGQKATVSGIYMVNRYLSIEDRWVKFTGKITWRLQRENSQLKIVSTNYDK